MRPTCAFRTGCWPSGASRSRWRAKPSWIPCPCRCQKRCWPGLETEPVSDLIDASGGGDTFLADDALDTARLPVAGTVLASDLQSGGLVLLVEDDEGDRLLQVIVLNADGTYRQSCLTAPLPPNTTLDLFHATDGEINFSWDEQHAQAGYVLDTDGRMAARVGMDSQ